MKISRIKELLDASVLSGELRQDQKIRSAGGGELMDDILKTASRDCVVLTGLSTIDVVKRCIAAEVGCLVLVRGKKTEPLVVATAGATGLPLLSTAYPLFVACGILYMNGLRGFDESW